MRQRPWKLAIAPQNETMGKGTACDASGQAPRLDNLDQEINEQTNLADKHPEVGGKTPTARRPAGDLANPQAFHPPERRKPRGKEASKSAKAADAAKPVAG